MESYYKIDCHHGAQEELSNFAVLMELEFANMLTQIQQDTGQQEPEKVSSEPSTSATNNSGSRNRTLDDRFPLPPPSLGEILEFLEEFEQDTEQVASEPSTSDFAPSPKRAKLSDCQLSTSQSVADFSSVPPTTTTNTVSKERTLDDTSEDLDLLEMVYGEDFIKFLEELVQEMDGVASEPIENNLCPSPKRTKESDYQPCSDWLMAGPSHVPSTATRKGNLQENKPYIKKPLNAFMLFRAEQRQRVVFELGVTDSATVNKEVGRRWKMLSEEEQAPYFEQALRERRAHQAKYPEWSARDNFGKKVKLRNTAATNYHHFGFPANQQLWSHGNGPMSFPPQAPYHQYPHYQTGGPSQHPHYGAWGPSKEPSGDSVTNNDQNPFFFSPNTKKSKLTDYQPSTCQRVADFSGVPPTSTINKVSKKRNLEENKPYIKKPLNAFMLFRAEQRQRVVFELGVKDSATVNKEAGRRWKMLSEEERAPYFEQALRERRAHQANYPDWSAKDNFGKKVRQRNTAPTNYHHFGFPANQQLWSHGTGPTSFPPQAPYHQHPHYQTGGSKLGCFLPGMRTYQ